MKDYPTRYHSWKATFRYAVNGALWAFKTQKNFKVHLVISFLVILLAIWLRIPFTHLIFLVLAIFWGFTIEMANTAMERVVDLVTEERRENAKLAKDVAAGMMLLLAIGLAVIGLLILLPPLWAKILGN
jgi:undecaprenol kinase